MSSVARETPAAAGSDGDRAVARETEAGSRPGLAARPLIALIRGYQRFLSPLMAPRCRYHPSCSSYAIEALRELGPLRGTIVAAWRVLRCNPFSAGGLDPLSERRLFRDHAHHPAHDRIPGGAR